MSSTFLARALSAAALNSSNVDDSSDPSYAERIVRINRERLKAKPDCPRSNQLVRKWSSKIERQRKGN